MLEYNILNLKKCMLKCVHIVEYMSILVIATLSIFHQLIEHYEYVST